MPRAGRGEQSRPQPAPARLPGSIRGDLGRDNTANTIHASDSPESAQRELGFFFPDLA